MKVSIEKAKKNIRMEEPNRILTRLAFDFMSEMISGFTQTEPSNSQHPEINPLKQINKLQDGLKGIS